MTTKLLRRLMFDTAIIVLIIFFLIGLIEVSTRIFLPTINTKDLGPEWFVADRFDRTFGYPPNASGKIWGAATYTDQYGFRVGSDGVSDALKEGSVLFLGDSIGFGVGVEFEDTYFSLVASGFPNKPFHNASVIGHTINSYSDIVNTFVQRNKGLIDTVIINLALNDLVDISSSLIRKQLGEKIETPRKPAIDRGFIYSTLKWLNERLNFNLFLRSNSKTYLLIKNLVSDASEFNFRNETLPFKDPKFLDLFDEFLLRISNQLKEDGIRLGVIILPFEFQLRHDRKDLLFPQKHINKACAALEISCFDLAPRLRAAMQNKGLSSKELYLFNDSAHFSIKGHELVANEIQRWLLSFRL